MLCRLLSLSFLTPQLGLVFGMHSKCSFRHKCWVVTPTDELGTRCRTHRRLAHVTFVCSTEPKMPPAMSKCCSTDLPSCPSKNLPCKRNVFCFCVCFFFFFFCTISNIVLGFQLPKFNEFSLQLSLRPCTVSMTVMLGCTFLFCFHHCCYYYIFL